MRLPNGYGSITKLSGNRRKPYAVNITVGWTDEGKQIRKVLGYTRTKKEGFQLLADYHNHPFDTDNSKLTFEELYLKWLPYKQKQNLSDKGILRYTNAYKYYKRYYDTKFIDISLPMLQEIIDGCPHGYHSKSDIKLLYSQMFKYAKLIDIPLTKNISDYIIMPKQIQSTIHKPFTEEEIDFLWQYSSDEFVKIILLLIYTGIRPNELAKISEIHDKYFITGSKTESGKDRIIPLHERVRPIFHEIIQKKLYKISYSRLRDNAIKKLNELNLDHKLYDCRHTFATRLDNANANELCVKKIMGHKIKDLTKGVYTHKDIAQLIETVNLVK